VFGASYFTIVVLLRARVETLRELVIRDTHALGEITKFAVRYFAFITISYDHRHIKQLSGPVQDTMPFTCKKIALMIIKIIIKKVKILWVLTVLKVYRQGNVFCHYSQHTLHISCS
jgi:hypothetical protein